MKTALHVSDTAWEGLKTTAFELGYVRNVGAGDAARGMSDYVTMLAQATWQDNRPEYLRETGQWHAGIEPLKERCLHISPQVIAELGRIALNHAIWPFKTQAPVVNGFRREATPPVLYPVSATPPGRTSVKALASPVLEAIGLGWLMPTGKLHRAPPSLYRQAPRGYQARGRRKMYTMSSSL